MPKPTPDLLLLVMRALRLELPREQHRVLVLHGLVRLLGVRVRVGLGFRVRVS